MKNSRVRSDDSDVNRRSIPWVVWSVACAFIVVSTLAIAGPMARAYRCVARYADAPTASAEVVEVTEEAAFVRLNTGARSGQTCSVPGRFEPESLGEQLEVTYLASVPERCELASTVRHSKWVLGAVAIGLASAFLLVAALAAAIVRTLTRPGEVKRPLEASDGGAVLCPACRAKMAEGYVALTSGLHWRELGEPVGITPLYRGLAGTVGIRGRPTLHAFQCERCEVLTLQYGTPDR